MTANNNNNNNNNTDKQKMTGNKYQQDTISTESMNMRWTHLNDGTTNESC